MRCLTRKEKEDSETLLLNGILTRLHSATLEEVENGDLDGGSNLNSRSQKSNSELMI